MAGSSADSAAGATLTVRSRRVVLPDQDAPVPATIVAEHGRIVHVDTSAKANAGTGAGARGRGANGPVLDVGDRVVMAGVVDTHVHVNEPGRTEWEGFITATRAAKAGGTTTIIDMPLNSIPATTTLAALEEKKRAARTLCAVDYGFWGGVVPGNAGELAPMVEAGARGFKAFLVESGVDEFKMVTEADLRQAMPILAGLGVPLLVHAELECPGAPAMPGAGERHYAGYLASRPQKWEIEAIRLMIRLAAELECRVHIVHLSAADALADIAEAKARGVPITVETCPHYLSFEAELIPDGATHYKCAPPIRERLNRQKLWTGLEDGTIDFIVSDHSPCTPVLKKLETGDFGQAWGGIAGLQFSLAAVWTEMRARALSLGQLSRWMSAAPARLAGLEHRKGRIAPGFDADLVVWDPDASYRLDRSMVLHRHSLTPYEGRILYGKVEQTFVRAGAARGEWLGAQKV